jgi:hypothetical protein
MDGEPDRLASVNVVVLDGQPPAGEAPAAPPPQSTSGR